MIDMDKPLVITHYDSSVDGMTEGHDFKSFMLMTLGAEGKDAKATLRITADGKIQSSRYDKFKTNVYLSADGVCGKLKDAIGARLQNQLEALKRNVPQGRQSEVETKFKAVLEAFGEAAEAAQSEDDDGSGLNCGKVKAIVRNVRWFEANVTVQRLLNMDASDLTQLATSKSARANADDYLDPDEADVKQRLAEIEAAVDQAPAETIKAAAAKLTGYLLPEHDAKLHEGMKKLAEAVTEVEQVKNDDSLGGLQTASIAAKVEKVTGDVGRLATSDASAKKIMTYENISSRSEILGLRNYVPYFTDGRGSKIIKHNEVIANLKDNDEKITHFNLHVLPRLQAQIEEDGRQVAKAVAKRNAEFAAHGITSFTLDKYGALDFRDDAKLDDIRRDFKKLLELLASIRQNRGRSELGYTVDQAKKIVEWMEGVLKPGQAQG